MAKDPAFLFYSSDFLIGVMDLTMEERGQYITLMCLQHQKGHLNEKTIRLSVGPFSVFVLEKFEKDLEGNLYNPRLEEEIEKRANFAESRRNNGKKGGRPKKTKPSENLVVSGRLHFQKPTNNLPEDENDNGNVSKIAIKKEPVNGFRNTKHYNEFKSVYPGNGQPYDMECEIYFSNLEEDVATEIIIKASEYVEYMKACYGDEYEYTGFLSQAQNFLKKERWKKDWLKMKSALPKKKKTMSEITSKAVQDFKNGGCKLPEY